MINALESLPGVVVLQVRLIDRLDGCEAVTGRTIRAEALEAVTCGDWRLRCVLGRGGCVGTSMGGRSLQPAVQLVRGCQARASSLRTSALSLTDAVRLLFVPVMCRSAALEFGTPLNEELFWLETEAMREEAEKLLQVRRGCVILPLLVPPKQCCSGRRKEGVLLACTRGGGDSASLWRWTPGADLGLKVEEGTCQVLRSAPLQCGHTPAH